MNIHIHISIIEAVPFVDVVNLCGTHANRPLSRKTDGSAFAVVVLFGRAYSDLRVG